MKHKIIFHFLYLNNTKNLLITPYFHIHQPCLPSIIAYVCLFLHSPDLKFLHIVATALQLIILWAEKLFTCYSTASFSSCFFIRANQALISSIWFLPSSFPMLYFKCDAPLLLLPQCVPHRECTWKPFQLRLIVCCFFCLGIYLTVNTATVVAIETRVWLTHYIMESVICHWLICY